MAEFQPQIPPPEKANGNGGNPALSEGESEILTPGGSPDQNNGSFDKPTTYRVEPRDPDAAWRTTKADFPDPRNGKPLPDHLKPGADGHTQSTSGGQYRIAK